MNKTTFPALTKDVHSPWPVLICIFGIAWMLAGLVFGVFSTAGAALFYNFVCDEEVCNFSGKDYKGHAPGDLGQILEDEARRKKENEKPDEKRKPDEEAPAEKAPIADK